MPPKVLVTGSMLRDDLRAIGVSPGGVLLLNSSLRSLGYVVGGAVAVVEALLDVLTPAGTLVVPAQTPTNRDPSRWGDPSVPDSWWPQIREHLPPYDPALSDCRAMGLIAETVRTWPGAHRSGHPQVSFAAVGARAAELTARHDLDSELGENSPLAAIEAAGGHTLLLGVGYDRCTAFHLAEYRLPGSLPRQPNSCAMYTENGREWVTYLGTRLDASDFTQLGVDLERETGQVARGAVGAAGARLLPVPETVAYAGKWFRRHR
ncbi:aminoglycoside 3-N-acetyltransferase [Actinoplanes tereljensis]|uniref:Aminoglycoside N(3)-acetyltransferase n=1 Tax=Paractinoplanes tereljensis TaxID=571912 RepID=A0A919NSF6_9ACTN|nr:AAC(3) family N-acetyltransferase [Actinoplanes tereljensis]GIF24309.1 AAC(3) family N-acetyltransferase [Actinoplanes tereljensis]